MIGSDLYSFRELWRQYRSCRRNKRNTENQLAFEVDVEAKLLELQAELRSHCYRPGTSICFVTQGAKPREVFAADFRDRIVHHLLVSRLEPIFERRFIHDSYACRKGKGTLAASDRLMGMLRRVTANGQRPAWALKLDVASFFPQVHKRTLYRILRRQVGNPELRWLSRVILFHDPTTDFRFNSVGPRRVGEAQRARAEPGSPRYPVAAGKSLFASGNRRGLPIGNLTSQFWANVYLNELDQYVKRALGCRCYLRYVDDLCLLSTDPAELESWRKRIAAFLESRLRLSLRAEPAPPLPVARGVDFVGWRTFWSHRLPRRRTLANLERRIDEIGREVLAPSPWRPARRIEIGKARSRGHLATLQSTLSSYSGHLRHGRADRVWSRLWRRHPWLEALFARDRWTLASRWPLARADASLGLATQIRSLTRGAGDAVLVFVPVGRFYEMRGRQRLLAERVLRLRTAQLRRGGYALAVGFPRRLWRVYAGRALGCGFAVLLADERPWPARPRLSRIPTTLFVPNAGSASRDRG